jgi:hypothetical protein
MDPASGSAREKRMNVTYNRSAREIAHYFEYSARGIQVAGNRFEEGLQEMHFGEFLVDRAGLTRQQLFVALVEQDRHPGVRLGEVIAALGYLPYRDVDRLLSEYHGLNVVEVA